MCTETIGPRSAASLASRLLLSMLFIGVLTRPAPATAGCDWDIVPSRNVKTQLQNELDGVSAVSGTDAWAVGLTSTGPSSDQTLTEHWNGSGWTVAPRTFLLGTNDFFGVAAISTNDVWAVGDESPDGNTILELTRFGGVFQIGHQAA